MIRWLVEEKKCSVDNEVLASAVTSGSIDLVRWLIDRGCATFPTIAAGAVKTRNIEMLEFLSSIESPMCGTVISGACDRKKFDVLDWFATHPVYKKNFSELNVKWTMKTASFSTVKFLVGKGSEVDLNSLYDANSEGRRSIVLWMIRR